MTESISSIAKRKRKARKKNREMPAVETEISIISNESQSSDSSDSEPTSDNDTEINEYESKYVQKKLAVSDEVQGLESTIEKTEEKCSEICHDEINIPEEKCMMHDGEDANPNEFPSFQQSGKPQMKKIEGKSFSCRCNHFEFKVK